MTRSSKTPPAPPFGQDLAAATDADPKDAPGWRPPSRAAIGLEPGLYVVATPIGNLRDVTLRALDVLAGADLILCEDTRVTRKLLDAFGISAKLAAYHDHNAQEMRPQIMAALEGGGRVALASDAGTPLVSDPGFKLVRAAAAAGHRVIPIPGASAPLAALVAAGLPTDRFMFAGFPPAKSNARATWLAEMSGAPATLVFFETAPRLVESLAAMAQAFGPQRDAAVARELTKMFEEVRRGSLGELADHYASAPARGEIVVVVGPASDEGAPLDEAALDADLRALMQAHPIKDAAALAAARFGLSRREAYARALALKGEGR